MGSPLIELGRRVAAAQARVGAEGTSPEALLRSLAARRRSARRAVAAAALLTGALVVGAGIGLRPRPLRFALPSGHEGQPGEWIAAESGAPLAVTFSDGSRLALDPAARARVAAVEPKGARLVLERGSVEARIVHREGTRWELDAGPFLVQVTGTRFRLSWQPEAERLALMIDEGSVRVTGPLLEAGRAVGAGEALEVRVPERALAVHRASGEPVAPASAAEAPAPLPAAPAPVSAAPPPPPRPPESTPVAEAPPSWRTLSALGRYREALARAEIEGFAEICRSAGAADLLTLGDTARFAGQGGRAREAYLTLRTRFPGAREAAVAAFVIGRLAFDRDGAYAEAARWFRTYLAEAPGGAYAREARGRLVEALQRGGDREGARQAAFAYLAADPDGPHAALARSLLAP
jgi:hypothetical protein